GTTGATCQATRPRAEVTPRAIRRSTCSGRPAPWAASRTPVPSRSASRLTPGRVALRGGPSGAGTRHPDARQLQRHAELTLGTAAQTVAERAMRRARRNRDTDPRRHPRWVERNLGRRLARLVAREDPQTLRARAERRAREQVQPALAIVQGLDAE